MKKIKVPISVMLLLLFTFSGAAEGFYIRNGISWGMSQEDVLATEDFMTPQSDRNITNNRVPITTVHIPYAYVAGVDANFSLIFLNNELSIMAYIFDSQTIDINTLLSAVSEKYGQVSVTDWELLFQAISYIDESAQVPMEGTISWNLEDGTYITLIPDASYFELIYFDLPRILSFSQIEKFISTDGL